MYTSPTRLKASPFAVLILMGISMTATSSAQTGTTREGIHVVRPGDTLESLALQYMGSSELWRDIWERNPEIKNPHFLRPGDKVLLPFRRLPNESAFVSKLSNRVEQWRPPLAREPSTIYDVLRAMDQLETGKRSSAEISFPDLSLLRLNEESKIILEPTSRLGTTVDRRQVELVTGQVDLEGESSAASPSSSIQLVMGDAKAAPQPSESGELRTRARMAESTAQLMVYSGSSELEAGGAKVAVDEGMGSSAKKGDASMTQRRCPGRA